MLTICLLHRVFFTIDKTLTGPNIVDQAQKGAAGDAHRETKGPVK